MRLNEIRFDELDSYREKSGLEGRPDLPRTMFSESVYKDYDASYIKCRNESLAGKLHEVSGVPFVSRSVEMNDGSKREGVFPSFESHFDAKLDESRYLSSDARQFKEANGQLAEKIRTTPELSGRFTEEHKQQIAAGDTPEGMVWHHAEQPGVLQLVDRTIHEQTAHTGGRSIWGGGKFYR